VKLSIDHATRYTYDSPVRASTQYIRLTPRDSARQRVLNWKLATPSQTVQVYDGYGNILHVLTLDKPVTEIVIRAIGVVETTAVLDEPSDFTGVTLSPLLFLRPTSQTGVDEALGAFAERYRRRIGTLTGVRELASGIHKKMPFKPGETQVSSSAADAFAIGSAVCQDHAHVFIACCRHLGVPARYVSGYVHSPGHAEMHVASHAWAEAWVLDRWHSFDIANNCPAGESHVKLAVGGDYLDACPIRGARTGGGTETMLATAFVKAEQ
jgi:transglutaminase-like putative cysteine protease